MAKHDYDHDHSHDHGRHHDHDHDHSHDHDHDHGHADTEAVEYETTISETGPASRKINITVTAEQIAAKLDGSFDELQSEAQLPGFRRGRAPLRLLEKRFGKDVRKETANQIVAEAYSAAIEKNDLRVLGEPRIKDAEDLALPDAGPLHIEIDIEVAPDVQLPDLKELEIRRPLLTVDDSRLDGEINRYRELYGKVAQATDAVREQDLVTAEVELLDAAGERLEHLPVTKVFVPGEKPNNYKGVIAGLLVEDLGKVLPGKTLTETVEFKATGPNQHENENLREKELTIRLRINGIERADPLTIEQLVAASGFETETELREHFRTILEQRARSEQRSAMAEQAADALLEKVDLELPQRLSAQQAQQILQRRAMDLLQRGVSQQEIEQHVAELRAASESEAARQLKLLFILDAVARTLDVEVTAEQVNGRVAMIAAQQGRRPEKLRQDMARSGQLDQLYVQLREEAAIDRVIQDAKVIDISAEEWRKMRGEDEGEKPAKPAKKGRKAAAKPEPAADAEPDDAGPEKPKPKPKKKTTTKKPTGKKKGDE